ncbi:DMT family transporter [Coralliovum pocilloporae]|uniref:DMT family transporter n=1 Tax=Coralliovum pocilloporae TaxID=3066369 RepID=UPI003306BB72
MPDNIRGSLFMIAAMAAFSLEDMFFKAATVSMPVGQALILFGALGGLVFGLWSVLRKEAVLHSAFMGRTLLLRSLCEIAGRLFFGLALALTPLSSTSAILQAAPLFVTLGAMVFFGERVGLQRWLCIILGFAGVLMILRPGFGSFEPASLFALLGTLGFAGRDLATRASPMTMSNAQLGTYGFLMLVVAGLILQLSSDTPLQFALPLTPWLQVSAAAAIGVVAYSCLTVAMRTGDVSVVTPFRYTRLLFAAILAMVVFGERPDVLTVLGSLLIVASGLYLVFRSWRQKPAL